MKNFVFLCALVNYLKKIVLNFAYEIERKNHKALARLSGFSVLCMPGFVTFVF